MRSNGISGAPTPEPLPAPRELAGEAALFAALVLCAAAIWLAFRVQRWLTRRRRQRRSARAQRAERDAAGLLEARGFEVLGHQVRQAWALTVDGRDLQLSLVADYIVERDGQRWVAEVKTGERSLDLHHGPTRRQLLEYRHAFGVEGVLLVDAEGQTLRDVRFQGTLASRRTRGVRMFLAGVVVGLALALAAWVARQGVGTEEYRLGRITAKCVGSRG